MSIRIEEYKKLLSIATTDFQKSLVNLLIKGKKVKDAAAELGISTSAFSQALFKLRAKFKKGSLVKDTHFDIDLAPYEELKGRSFLKNELTGQTVLQWYKTRANENALKNFIESAISSVAEGVIEVNPLPEPATVDNELISCYIVTDYHLGSMALNVENNQGNWDLSIAEDMLVKWIDEAIVLTPNAETAVLAQMGDFLHFDGLVAMTNKSGHVLDTDTVFSEIVAVATRLLIYIIQRLLVKHKTVHVLLMEGNHDESSSVWLREMFYQLFKNEPRVTVDKTSKPYYCFEHGQVSLFFHHGHLTKLNNLPFVFASIFREVYGRTKYSYGHAGHYHHAKLIENNMMVLEQHQTLPPKDRYSSRHGYGADRSGQIVTYNKNKGEVSRIRIRPGNY